MRKIAFSSKAPQQDPVELPRRGEVRAERLLDDDAGALRVQPALPSCSTTVPNSAGGMAR